ncbi:MAG: aspartate-semialdehyde dehydrogenase [Proteobacteria bacterium]|nr:aspartate-semialdehyde dehydrogenase [Pseudomonadota bacterium]NDD05225.1 aspartate-semialdehyde dehydrogenase [Pseudomonadota bacterium]
MKVTNLENIRSLAIVGATGLVGTEFLELLAESKIRIPDIRLLASHESAGESVEIAGEEVKVEAVSAQAFQGVEVAFFSVPTEVTEKYVPLAVKAGAVVVDDSSTYRLQDEVPLVVPEVNPQELRTFTGQIVSTPNCTVTPLVLALKPLADRFGLKRVIVSTYQSVSGAGRAAYEELSVQTAALLNGQPQEAQVFSHRIAFNCLPQIGAELPNGNTSEEEKMVRETRKILQMPELGISATCVRVPTFFGHGLSVNVELKKDFDDVEEIRELFDGCAGLGLIKSIQSDQRDQ